MPELGPAPVRRAVVVGINHCQDTDNIKPLAGAINDATDIHKKLTENGGFQIDQQKYFLSDDAASAESIADDQRSLLGRDELRICLVRSFGPWLSGWL